MLVKRGASGSTLRQGQGGPRPTRRGRALVSTSSTSRKPSSTSRGDEGSALVSVVVLMLVLTLFALTLAAVVTNTTRTMAGSRSHSQGRVSADAGLAAVLAAFKKNSATCPSPTPSRTATPRYSTTCVESSGQVTFTSTGDPGLATAKKVEAVYVVNTSSTAGGAAELVFFNTGSDSVYFTNHVLPQSSTLSTILFPGGGTFECKTTVPGNIIMAGSFLGQSGCIVNGSVWAGGENPAQGKWALYLNNDDQVLGSATAVGKVAIGGGSSKIGGTLTLPSSAELQIAWMNAGKPTSNARVSSGASGAISWPASVAKPTLAGWFEYTHSDAQWVGYAPVKITASSTPYNCSNINDWSTTFWSSYVSGLTQDTVIDMTACSDGIKQVKNGKATIGVNVALIGNRFILSDFALTPKAGKDPRAFIVVPDPNSSDNKPTCSGSRTIETNAAVNVTVKTMAYTPCTIRVGYGGVWTGAMYSGTLDDGGDIKIYTSPMGLPGQFNAVTGGPSGAGTKSLGDLVSRRDVNP